MGHEAMILEFTNEARRMADRIGRALPDVPSGTLRFWGVWFGAPHDNIHQIVRCEVEGDVLRLHFDNEEMLSIWSPCGLTMEGSTFRIADAQRVRWDWFLYGQPRIIENLCFYDYVKCSNVIEVHTNSPAGRQYQPDPDRLLPAVEIVP